MMRYMPIVLALPVKQIQANRSPTTPGTRSARALSNFKMVS